MFSNNKKEYHSDDPFAGTNNDSLTIDKSVEDRRIPNEYSEFPRFPVKANQVNETKTHNYHRVSMYYFNYDSEQLKEYISRIGSDGYIQSTKVRYDKGNTYIIVDEMNGGTLNIVFHIKR